MSDTEANTSASTRISGPPELSIRYPSEQKYDIMMWNDPNQMNKLSYLAVSVDCICNVGLSAFKS